MKKKLATYMAILILAILAIGILPISALTTKAADTTSIPTSFIEYSNGYGAAQVSIPPTGNITRMNIIPVHQDKSSTTDNYDVLAIQLSSNLTSGIAAASISTNYNPQDISWRKALRNGSSTYTEINGNVVINNLFQVTAGELKIQRVGSRLTVDFNPANPIAITLPVDTFPTANFSTTWAVPAFHMDIDSNATGTIGNSTSSNPSGWSEFNEYVSYAANYTFNSPTLNNYKVSGAASARGFNVHRGVAPSGIIIPADPEKTVDFVNYASANFSIPSIGGMTRIQITAMHDIQGTMGVPDVLGFNLAAAGYNGLVEATLTTNPDLNALKWQHSITNGTSKYTEVNGNVTINNFFIVSPNDLKVQLNGTRMTVDFNPTTPINLTLPPEVFPRANFSAIWTLPALHIDYNINPALPQLLILNNSQSFVSGWKQNNDFVLDFTNATLTVPSWNFTTSVAGTTNYLMPYMLTFNKAPNFDTAWTLVATQSLKAYPNLVESIWQKTPNMNPNGPYNTIGLHRLVKANTVPQGVIFLTNCPTWGTGDERITNPPTDNWTKYENFSQAIYLANRGFDVYAIDYRSHFIPKNLTPSQMGFMADWSWDVIISDVKEATDKAKAVSGASKFFISGECSGAEVALNYATKYQSDLKGIILLDTNFLGVTPPPPTINVTRTTNTYNLTTTLASMTTAKNWTRVDYPQWMKDWIMYAFQNPNGPAIGPNGTAPAPAINPSTNQTWANMTEYFMGAVQNNFGLPVTPGLYSNVLGGYGNLTQDEYCFLNSDSIPLRLLYENAAMFDWTNCPYMTYDYNDHYKEINVPVLAFESSIFGSRAGPFQFVNGMATSDFTGVILRNYGHMDVFIGTNSARDVSQPTYQWMLDRFFTPTIDQASLINSAKTVNAGFGNAQTSFAVGATIKFAFNLQSTDGDAKVVFRVTVKQPDQTPYVVSSTAFVSTTPSSSYATFQIPYGAPTGTWVAQIQIFAVDGATPLAVRTLTFSVN